MDRGVHEPAPVAVVRPAPSCSVSGVARIGSDPFPAGGKIREIVRAGRTVLFISYDMQAIRELCRRCLVLDRVRLVADGDVEPCIGTYYRLCRGEEPRDAGQDGEPNRAA